MSQLLIRSHVLIRTRARILFTYEVFNLYLFWLHNAASIPIFCRCAVECGAASE